MMSIPTQNINFHFFCDDSEECRDQEDVVMGIFDLLDGMKIPECSICGNDLVCRDTTEIYLPEHQDKFKKYYGRVLATGEIKEFEFVKRCTAEEVCQILSILNRNANEYGIVYFLHNK